jgi:RNA polymerase sigma-70 factor, ECF subfamily
MAQPIAWTFPVSSNPEWELTVVRPNEVAADATGTPGTPGTAATDLSDLDLVAACLDGRPGAFDVIVERHRRSVYQLCYRFVGNHEDASDLSQDVFLRAYRGLKRFRGQSTLSTWLYRIGVNVCLNRVSVKAPASEPIELHPQVDTRNESPAERVLRDERAIRVRAAIAQLPHKQRIALILRMYHEMSHQEIADTVGGSVGAVKANVFHALQNLKKRLGEEPL